MTTTTSTRDRLDLAGLDDLLSTDEKDVRATVRQLCETAVDPYVADWFERGEIDDVPGLAKDSGRSACSVCTSTATAAPA